MIPTIDNLIDKFAKKFRIEQRIVSEDEKLVLVTESYLSSRLLYTHEMDLLPLLEEMKKRL